MNELRNMVEESVDKLFADQIDRDFQISVEENGWPQDLWDMLLELGIDRVMVSEENDGMGGTWSDAFPVFRAAGQYGVPLPIAEAIIGAWLIDQAGLAPQSGVPGLIPESLSPDSLNGDAVSATIERIPWGRNAEFFIAIAGNANGAEIIIIGKDGATIDEDINLARDPRDTVTFNGAPIIARAETSLVPDTLRWLCALARSAQIAGAGSACLQLGLEYTSEREQFGRPLARFQAIQHHLAHMAGELATVEAMSATAFKCVDQHGLTQHTDRNATFEIAAAKCRASDAVEPLSKIGHQVHGAIGFTYEYGMHFLTRRLWSWRSEFGGSSEWAQHLGRTAIALGGDEIWGKITA